MGLARPTAVSKLVQYARIGSDNDLAPSRRQAIIWTNVDLIRWRIYAALGEMG